MVAGAAIETARLALMKTRSLLYSEEFSLLKTELATPCTVSTDITKSTVLRSATDLQQLTILPTELVLLPGLEVQVALLAL